MTIQEARLGAVASALLAPPVITYWISSTMGQSGLGIFSIFLFAGVGFASAVWMLKPRAWNAVLAGLLYFPMMFIVIFWIGYRAGYYDMP